MTSGARERPPAGESRTGLADGDPLASRLFPSLPGVVKWGLGRTERMLAALDHPHLAYPVLHVGGTNGKGSVARIWASILRAAGFSTGLYTSPHLISFRERILIDGRPLPDDLLEEWSRDLRPLFLREKPSWFEAATTLAFLAFARAEVDVAIIEVGVGGRLDATNVVSPVLTAITNVAWEHSDLLGRDLTAIAREKAGILKSGVPVFTSSDDPIVLSVIAEEAAGRGALLHRISTPRGRVRLEGSRLRIETGRWGRLELASSLTGPHQLRNLGLAVRSLEALPPRLPVSSGAVREGVLRVRGPGRFQVEREGGRTWILDAAHNLHGMQALSATLASVETTRPRVGVVGILSDKPWKDMILELAPCVDSMILTIPDSAPQARRWDPSQAASWLSPEQVRVVPELGRALEMARMVSGEGGTVIVAGSLYTVGDSLRYLDRIPLEALPTSSGSE